jgi:N-acetylmuramoyl-L-alanine amidase
MYRFNFYRIFHVAAAIIVTVSLIACVIHIHADVAKTAASENAKNAPTVVIDAGHGGEDCGAIGTSGVYEKDLNLAVSLKLAEYLNAAGYTTVLTRTDDRLLYKEDENIKGMRKICDLKNRVAIANSTPNAIFISIHMNSYGSSGCRGLQAYYGTFGDSDRLAMAIQSNVAENLQPTNKRTIKRGDGLYLLENATVPSVIVECGFLSNPNDLNNLKNQDYQLKLAVSLSYGIIDYIKSDSEKEES